MKCAQSTFVRLAVTRTVRLPARGSTAMKMFAVPRRSYSLSYFTTSRDGEHFHGGGTSGRQANGPSDRQAHEGRLGAFHLPPVDDGLSEGGGCRAGDGQLEHAWHRQPVRGLRSDHRTCFSSAPGNQSHAETW